MFYIFYFVGHEGPNVSGLSLNVTGSNNEETSTSLANSLNKSNILQKKPIVSKKKGLGAQKVNTDFKEIEKAMIEQEKAKELDLHQQMKVKEEQEKLLEKQIASMKLAYNNLDKQREKEEAKLMQVDPKKAQQLERLGMAVGMRSTGITHSALSDMQIIQQEGTNRSNVNIISNLPSGNSFSRGNPKDLIESDFSSNLNQKGRFDDESDIFRGFDSSILVT
jgi:ADP-ribosylation factor GTPase-activating protein 2/3